MNVYTLIAFLYRIGLKTLATRMADYFFPLAPWETMHNLSDYGWADSMEPDEYWNSIVEDEDGDGFDGSCNACVDPERYDEHIHEGA